MSCRFHFAMMMVATIASLTNAADDMAWGDLLADGSLETRSLDVAVATARGAENFFIANPMDSHDWSHTSIVRKSLSAEVNGTSAKVKMFQKVLAPIFTAMPKDAEGRLSGGTARYALHRHFSQMHGWFIKGLEPAGAAWMSTQSVTPDVKDINKYMVPSYLQQLLLQQLGVSGFDLRSLAILAAVIDHMIHAEMISYVYSIFTTLKLPIPGKKAKSEVDDIIDTFMMVFAFGMNLDVSTLQDVKKAKAHLEKSHSGWPQMQRFAQEVKLGASMDRELDFTEIVQLVEKISEGYANFQGKDCARAKEYLVAQPSHHNGRVKLSEVKALHAIGQRSLFTESVTQYQKLGVVFGGSEAAAEVIIPNYVNSQSMCLSTASMYAVCCVNECDALLSSLERDVKGPAAEPAHLARLVAALPGGDSLGKSLLQEFSNSSLVEPSSSQILLHGHKLAAWMYRAFPLACPAPHRWSRVVNPKTPEEWIGDRENLEVKNLEEMMEEVAEVLARYTTMGKAHGAQALAAEHPVSDASVDVVRMHTRIGAKAFGFKFAAEARKRESESQYLATVFRIAAMASMMVLVGVVLSRQALCGACLVFKGLAPKTLEKDFV